MPLDTAPYDALLLVSFGGPERAEDYEYGIDPKLKYHGKNCMYLRPRVPEPRDFAAVTQMITANPFRNWATASVIAERASAC